MKKMALATGIAASFALAATAAQAKFDEPLVEPEIIIEDTASGSHDWVVPLMLLVVIGALLASNATPADT